MTNSLLSETVFEKLLCRTAAYIREYRTPILGSFICGLLTYMYLFTNKLVNLDDLCYLFGKGATLESGRWGLVMLSAVFPDYSMPWIYGIMSLAMITVGICLCIHIFQIRNKALQFLVAGVMVTFPPMSATFSYTFTISAYAVSFILAILPVYLLQKGGKGRALAALVSCILSVSIYQAYIAITASLLILVLIRQTLGSDVPEGKLFLRGLGYVAFLAASLGLYWGITQLVWQLSGTAIGSYADAAVTFDRLAILRNVKNAYANSFRILWSGFYGIIATPVSKAAHLLCGAIAVVEALVWAVKCAKPRRFLLLTFLALLLPLSMNCMFLLVNDIMIHSLVMYGFTALYLLVAILLENGQCLLLSGQLWNRIRRVGYNIVPLGLAVVIAGNIWFANKAYLNLHLQYESTHAFTTTVIASLQNTPGFRPDSKVAIVGEYQKPQSLENAFSFLEGIYGLEGISPNTYSIQNLFEYYNGIDLNFASSEEIRAACDTEAFSQMPLFPGYGSVCQINGIFVIRLS